MGSRKSRSRSRSVSKGRRRRRSSERHRRSHSRDHHHKSSRSERQSRSHSRDRHVRCHSGDREKRDGRRRHRSSSRNGHGHRCRSSPGHRHHRRSQSPVHRKGHRSRSPLLSGSSSKPEETVSSSTATSSTATTTSRPPVLNIAGVKFGGRGRGTTFGSYKDKLKEEYIQQVQQAQNVVDGNGPSVAAGPSPLTSIVATVSAGTGLMGPGGMNQVLTNEMYQLRNAQNYVQGQPGVLTDEQKAINQRYVLQATGRTREQVEATYGVKIPKFYDESKNDLVEIAKTTRKRSRLWNNPDKKMETHGPFNAVPFLPGHDKKENLKFVRLLGSRKGKPKEENEEEAAGEGSNEAEEKAAMESEILNKNLSCQYESGRVLTHLHRGSGLGYSGTTYQPH